MNRAFVKEQDASPGDALPDIPISEHPNYVTPFGLIQLKQRLGEALARRDALQGTEDTMEKQAELAPLERDIRWLQSRVGGAIEVSCTDQPLDRIAFGALVTVNSAEGQRTYRVVGEDEADVEHGMVSYVSPLARALLGARVGDEVTWRRPAGDLSIEVLAIDYR
jgi:transcription elongation factor GreB